LPRPYPLFIYMLLLTVRRPIWLLSYVLVILLWLLIFPAVSQGQALPHQTGKVHTEQVDLGYEVFGDNRTALPLLVVNGGPGLSHAYLMPAGIWQQFARKRRVFFYDQRGTGASKPLPTGAPQTMATQVADLEALRKGLGLEKIILLGDSYGGLLAIAYASAYPDHIAKLILSDAASSNLRTIDHLFDQVFPEAMAQEKSPQPSNTNAKEQANEGLRRHFALLFYSLAQRDLYFKKLGSSRNLGFEADVAEAVTTDALKADYTPKLAGFTFPTLVLTGRYDMNVAPLTAWRLRQAITGAQIVFFEKSGHFPWFEEPTTYLTVVEQFLNK
jgi:proline iminopeptidase